MNREIKFRGKTLNYDPATMPRWAFGWYYQELHDGEIRHLVTDGSLTFEVDPDTIEQFTGLHDKDGKEIYEGDIVTKYLDRDKFVCEYVEKYACFAFLENVKHGVLYYFQKCDEKDLEVLGNIHDNPELMEGGAR